MVYPKDFEDKVKEVTSGVYRMLVEKNKAYGNSALDPVRIFSKASTREQLLVRIDDKLSRIARGNEFPGEDVIDDLLGYLVLVKLANQESSKSAWADVR